jgi:hypothetical protein
MIIMHFYGMCVSPWAGELGESFYVIEGGECEVFITKPGAHAGMQSASAAVVVVMVCL